VENKTVILQLIKLFCAFILFAIVSFFIEAKEKLNSCRLDLMPCPQYINLGEGDYVAKSTLQIYIKGMSSQRKLFALKHFGNQLKRVPGFSQLQEVVNKENADIVIDLDTSQVSQLKLTNDYQHPNLGDDESYQLVINNAQISIQSATDFGALHGLTTLLQLISNEGNEQNLNNEIYALYLPQLIIIDNPRFKWRGLLIDSVRHFIPIDDIKRQLDGMAAAKLNVFHWHLTDDQGWRVESKSYPKLQQHNADSLFYSQEQIIDLVSYASLLGIRVVPEFDIPGHASAIAVAYPELITEKKSLSTRTTLGGLQTIT
jgi:hexosaminidase